MSCVPSCTEPADSVETGSGGELGEETPAQIRMRSISSRVFPDDTRKNCPAPVEPPLDPAIPLPADAVIAGLLEAEILLREDRTGKVRSLVRTLQPDVESIGLKREALVAYRRFVSTVERGAATPTMARELAKAIERSGTRP